MTTRLVRLLIATAACSVASAQSAPPSATSAPPSATSRTTDEPLTARQRAGKVWFETSCSYCHDEGHHAARLLSKRLGKDNALVSQRNNLTATYIRYVVRHGVMSMPWYRRSELPDPDLDTIVDYLTRSNPQPAGP